MARRNQKREELIEQLKDQLNHLQDLTIAFDKGDYKKAKWIAGCTRTLVKDNRNTISLLQQLDLKQNLIDTSIDFKLENCEGTITSLTFNLINNHTHHAKPILDSNLNNKHKTFDEWWNQIVIHDFKKNKFSRKKLIECFADNDGGAHVDPGIEEEFYQLTRENSSEQFIFSNLKMEPDGSMPKKLDFTKAKPVISPAYYAVRQIAHEIFISLKVKYSLQEDLYNGIAMHPLGFK